jgi:hypothetical protein
LRRDECSSPIVEHKLPSSVATPGQPSALCASSAPRSSPTQMTSMPVVRRRQKAAPVTMLSGCSQASSPSSSYVAPARPLPKKLARRSSTIERASASRAPPRPLLLLLPSLPLPLACGLPGAGTRWGLAAAASGAAAAAQRWVAASTRWCHWAASSSCEARKFLERVAL